MSASIPGTAPETRRFITFVLTSGLAAGVNVGSRWLLSLILPYAAAVALAYCAGMATAFLLARAFVFERTADWRGELARFAMVNAIAFAQVWCVSMVLAELLFPWLGFAWHADTVAHVVGVGSPIVTSYLLHKHFSFGRRFGRDPVA